ncbi:hypothetical protein SELMODRAFT_411946 [Selaginella moellendorffii]|uniref:non-specific serine/threonine protein kinase n=1 Tax=Selaginella moellendorffii TaxID=88036 RepID=D8RJJ1_SELML|nr:hypothetical protein SELMODRAFT_411946 [Selaginella moellendorffii]
MAGFSIALLSRFRGYIRRKLDVDPSQVGSCLEKRRRPEEEPPPPLKGKARRLFISCPGADRCDSGAVECEAKEDLELSGANRDGNQGKGNGVAADVDSLPVDQRACLEAPDDLQGETVLEFEASNLVPDNEDQRQEVAHELVPIAPHSAKAIDEVFHHRTKGPIPIPNLQNYRIEGVEGSGAYSVVFKARRFGDGRLFAIKWLLLTILTGPLQGDKIAASVDKEIKLLKLFGGKHSIIRLEEVIRDGEKKYLVLEHVEYDSIQSLKKDISMNDLRSYGFHLFKALNYMHQKNIIHRDVKPGNFLYSRKSKVGHLVDFNLALEQDLAGRAKRRLPNQNRQMQCSLPADITFTEERNALLQCSRLEADAEDFDKMLKRLRSADYKSQEHMQPVQMTRKPLREYVTSNIPSNQARKRVGLKPTSVTDIKPLATIYPSCSLDRRRIACVGTKGYGAPEVLLGSPQTVKVDIWSAAVTLLQIATGKLPFSNGGVPKTIQEIAKLCGTRELKELVGTKKTCFLEELKHDCDGTSISEWIKSPELPSSFLDLISKCLKANPEERISAREAMQHEFFSPCLRARKAPEHRLVVAPVSNALEPALTMEAGKSKLVKAIIFLLDSKHYDYTQA